MNGLEQDQINTQKELVSAINRLAKSIEVMNKINEEFREKAKQ